MEMDLFSILATFFTFLRLTLDSWQVLSTKPNKYLGWTSPSCWETSDAATLDPFSLRRDVLKALDTHLAVRELNLAGVLYCDLLCVPQSPPDIRPPTTLQRWSC